MAVFYITQHIPKHLLFYGKPLMAIAGLDVIAISSGYSSKLDTPSFIADLVVEIKTRIKDFSS